MKSYLVSCILRDGSFRGVAAVTTRIIDKVRKQQDTLPTAIAALGRTLTGAALLSSLLKEGQKLSIQINSSGPIGGIFSEADAKGNLRGYLKNPSVHMPIKNGKLDVAGAVGKTGKLSVVKDLGLKQPYVGSVKLFSGEIAEDIAYYLTASEQIPSAVSLGVYVKKSSVVGVAGGFLIQVLPGTPEQTIWAIEENLKDTPPVTNLLRKGMSAEELLEYVFRGFEVIMHERKPLFLRCGCRRSKGKEVLRLLGRKELESIVEEGKPVELTCHFCKKDYTFDIEEVRAILTRSAK